MINRPPSFQGPNIRIPIIIPNKGRGVINQGSTLEANLLLCSHLLHANDLVRRSYELQSELLEGYLGLYNPLLGGPWDLVTPYIWAYNPTYN